MESNCSFLLFCPLMFLYTVDSNLVYGASCFPDAGKLILKKICQFFPPVLAAMTSAITDLKISMLYTFVLFMASPMPAFVL